jgi:hypothetical protein
VRLLALCVALLAAPAPSSAQPLIYSSPGSYRLPTNVDSADVIAVWVVTSNVSLDLGGRTIRCLASDSVTTFGIYASAVSNLTIRNGRIENCAYGVYADSSVGVTIEDVDFSGTGYIGAHLAWGAGNIVRRCIFAGIAGYTLEAYAIGINGVGDNSVIEHNQFRSLYKQPGATTVGEGVGILVEADATGVTIRDNVFTNTTLAQHTIGIWIAGGATASVTGSLFTNWQYAIAAVGSVAATGNTFTLTGVLAPGAAISAAGGLADNNTFGGYSTPMSGTIIDRGNTSVPGPARWFRVCAGDANTCYEGLLPVVAESNR